MSDYERFSRRITRRSSFKMCLLPAGAIAGGWLIGCSKAGQAMNGQLAGSAGALPTAGSSPAAGSGVAGTAATTGGSPASAAAGAVATAGSAAPQIAGAGGMASSAGTGGASTAAGAPSAAVGGSGGTPAMAAGSAAPAAGSGSTMMLAAGWAMGGTKVMTGNYPDPFTTAPSGAACNLYPTQTIGPCYSEMPMMREDISSGTPGLPVRLSFLVVRNGCTPISGASVDIWHSGYNGIYSAYATGTICNPSTTDVMKDTFCRGVQLTDETGRVNFNTVFPGWYSGRAVHIHFTIRVNGREEVTSQLYFEDALITEIQSQGEYKVRGMRETTNEKDTIFRSGGATPAEVILSTAKRTDGALHAWKVLSIG